MSDMLSIGASGVRAYQTALATTSENIANAGTVGYSRRTATVREVATAGGTNSGSAAGMGVTISGIVRAGEAYRAAEVRSTGADLARTESGIAWLERIEGTLTGNKLGDRLTAFFTAARTLAADPASLAPRAAMLEAAASVAAAFTATGAALRSAAADLDSSAEVAVSELNSLSVGLAKVNAGLARAAPGGSGHANLLDQRDQLLEALSAIGDIAVSFDGAGRATVKGSGGGPVLVEGDRASVATYVRSGGAVSFAVHRDGEAHALTPSAGALAGLAEGAQRIDAAREQVEALATAFADGVDAVQAGGRDLAGNPGEPMFEIGDPPSQLSLALVDPRGIAAAAVGGGVRDNGNLAAFQTLRTSGAFEDGVTSLVSANGAALSARRNVADAQTAMHDAAITARESVSGVNIDEEAVDLLRFQQAYQASSRVIQIARETLQSILEIR
jgi:flagellar hook-associated protein 1 FlgK